jgi:hypothetical protein
MTVYRLSFRESYTSNRDCMIVIQPQRAAYQALCVDAATRLTIGCPPIPRCADGSRPAISATDIMGMIGEYRLASIAVDIEAHELAQRSRRISARLRPRGRRRRPRSESPQGRTDRGVSIAAAPTIR